MRAVLQQDVGLELADGGVRTLSSGTVVIYEEPDGGVPTPSPGGVPKSYRELAVIAKDRSLVEVLKIKPASLAAVQKVVRGVEPPLKNFKDASEMNSPTGLTYVPLRAPAFVAGTAPAHTDVYQGSVGTCHLLSSAAASLVATPPHSLRSVIVPVGESATLYRVNAVKNSQAFSFHISSQVPVAEPVAGIVKLLKAQGGPAAWSALLEKAFVQADGGVATKPDECMRWLGLSDVSVVNDLSTLPGLFSQGYAIALSANNHAYYVLAASEGYITIVDPRTHPLARLPRFATDGDVSSVYFSDGARIWLKPLRVSVSELQRLGTFTGYVGRPKPSTS